MENTVDLILKVLTGAGLLKLGWGGIIFMMLLIYEKERRFWAQRDALKQKELEILESKLTVARQSRSNEIEIGDAIHLLQSQLSQHIQKVTATDEQLAIAKQAIAEKDRLISKLNNDNNILRRQDEQRLNLKSVLSSFSMPNIGAEKPMSQ